MNVSAWSFFMNFAKVYLPEHPRQPSTRMGGSHLVVRFMHFWEMIQLLQWTLVNREGNIFHM